MKNFILLSFTYILLSCGSNPHQEKVESLDSMKVELSTMKTGLQSIDTTSARGTYDTIARYLTLIKQSIKDTLTMEEATYMSDYYGIRKPFMNFSTSFRLFSEELDYTISQLDDLARSLEKKKVPEEKVDEYYELEMKSAQTLQLTLEGKIHQMQQLDHKFDSLHPMVVDFISRAQAE